MEGGGEGCGQPAPPPKLECAMQPEVVDLSEGTYNLVPSQHPEENSGALF